MEFRRIWWMAAIPIYLAGFSVRSSAQTMRFSVYAGWSVGSDGNTLYSSESVIDQSSCNLHTNYATTAAIYAPDGRHASSQNSGLAANASIALNGVSGNYSLVASGTYYCGCAFVNSGFGAGISLPISFAVTYSVKTANWTDAGGYCPQVSNCSPYVIPKCNVPRIKEAYQAGIPCHNFHATLTPVVNGVCATLGVSTEAGGPGPCTPQ